MNTFIKQYDNIISDKSCDYLIKCFDKYSHKTNQGATGDGVDSEVKLSTDLQLLMLSSMAPKKLKTYDSYVDMVVIPEIYTGIKKCLIKYCRSHSPMSLSSNGNLNIYSDEEVWCGFYSNFTEDTSSILLKKYTKNKGLFNWHMDTGPGSWMSFSRVLVTMFYLNDVEEGGETGFKYQGVNIKPKKGSVVIFPANWSHLHRGKKPISSDKYIGNMWWCARNPALNEEIKNITRLKSAEDIFNFKNTDLDSFKNKLNKI